jgi:3-oxoacyl-[acyl-carrier protein] reductase
VDLGIKGRWAIVEAASKGLGKGSAAALAAEGVNLVLNARGKETLEETADKIRADNPEIQVLTLAGDITQIEIREALIKMSPQIDILVTNAGGPAPGNFRTDTRERWLSALEAQLLGHADMITKVVDQMVARNFGRIVNITSASVKMPVENLGLSTAARMALTGFASTISRELIQHNVVINNLLPGPFETDRLTGNMRFAADRAGEAYEDVYAARVGKNPAKRFGTPEEFGAVCAFLCSNHVGFMTAQNVLMDGGAFPGNI